MTEGSNGNIRDGHSRGSQRSICSLRSLRLPLDPDRWSLHGSLGTKGGALWIGSSPMGWVGLEDLVHARKSLLCRPSMVQALVLP